MALDRYGRFWLQVAPGFPVVSAHPLFLSRVDKRKSRLTPTSFGSHPTTTISGWPHPTRKPDAGDEQSYPRWREFTLHRSTRRQPAEAELRLFRRRLRPRVVTLGNDLAHGMSLAPRGARNWRAPVARARDRQQPPRLGPGRRPPRRPKDRDHRRPARLRPLATCHSRPPTHPRWLRGRTRRPPAAPRARLSPRGRQLGWRLDGTRDGQARRGPLGGRALAGRALGALRPVLRRALLALYPPLLSALRSRDACFALAPAGPQARDVADRRPPRARTPRRRSRARQGVRPRAGLRRAPRRDDPGALRRRALDKGARDRRLRGKGPPAATYPPTTIPPWSPRRSSRAQRSPTTRDPPTL